MKLNDICLNLVRFFTGWFMIIVGGSGLIIYKVFTFAGNNWKFILLLIGAIFIFSFVFL